MTFLKRSGSTFYPNKQWPTSKEEDTTDDEGEDVDIDEDMDFLAEQLSELRKLLEVLLGEIRKLNLPTHASHNQIV